jgi:general secretion pathway protein G
MMEMKNLYTGGSMICSYSHFLKQRSTQAFTLSAMVIPRLVGRSEQARIAVAKTDIESNISTGLKMYELDNGFFPSTSQGLEALLNRPATSPMPENWNGPYIEKIPQDPWGNAYTYISPGKNRPDYDLYSKGKDSASDADDITNWK